MLAVELLAISAVVCIVTLCFEHAEYFHISNFTYLWSYNVLTSLIMFDRTNQSCSPSKLGNQSLFYGKIREK